MSCFCDGCHVSVTGVIDYLSTEICTSKQKKFSLVTFVDTPGLVDGDMKYPFDVNECIEWLGELFLPSWSCFIHFLDFRICVDADVWCHGLILTVLGAPQILPQITTVNDTRTQLDYYILLEFGG